jgi:hypothetical protein
VNSPTPDQCMHVRVIGKSPARLRRRPGLTSFGGRARVGWGPAPWLAYPRLRS